MFAVEDVRLKPTPKRAQALRSPVNLGNSTFGNRADETPCLTSAVDFSSKSPVLGTLAIGSEDVVLASRNRSARTYTGLYFCKIPKASSTSQTRLEPAVV